MDIKEKQKLVDAFEHMVENVADAIRDAEQAVAPTVDEMVHNAQVLARELFALTQEEAENLGATLKRDMHKANQVLNQQGKELKDWWSFDLSLVEDKFVQMIERAADKTWLDLHAFDVDEQDAGVYRSGDVCNPGKFECSECGQATQLEKTGPLATCTNCSHTEFIRIVN